MAEPSEIGPHQRCTLIQINTTSEIGQSLPHRLQSRPNPRRHSHLALAWDELSVLDWNPKAA